MSSAICVVSGFSRQPWSCPYRTFVNLAFVGNLLAFSLSPSYFPKSEINLPGGPGTSVRDVDHQGTMFFSCGLGPVVSGLSPFPTVASPLSAGRVFASGNVVKSTIDKSWESAVDPGHIPSLQRPQIADYKDRCRRLSASSTGPSLIPPPS